MERGESIHASPAFWQILKSWYDVPLDKAYQHGYYKQMVLHIRSLFSSALTACSAIKRNSNLCVRGMISVLSTALPAGLDMPFSFL